MATFKHALFGAVDTWKDLTTFREKLRFGAWFSRGFASELCSQIGLIPVLGAIVACKQRSQVFFGTHAYADLSARQRVDVYKPTQDYANGLCPIAVLVHGGAWCAGGKLLLAGMGNFLARRGCLCVVVGYRTYPEALVAAQVEDVQTALAWTVANGLSLGGDINRVTLYGHSSGAHVAMMAVIQENKTLPRPELAAFVGSAGVYDPASHVKFEAWRGVSDLSTMKPAFGGYQGLDSWSPYKTIGKRVPGKGRYRKRAMPTIHFAGRHKEPLHRIEKPANFPRVFLQTSTVDAVVPWTESSEFHEELGRQDIESHLLIYNGMSHSDFVSDFSRLKTAASRDSLAVQFTSLPYDKAGLEQFEAQLPCQIFDLLQIIQSTKARPP